MKTQVSQLTPEQLPHALMLAMKRKTVPGINWDPAGKLIEKEKISLIYFGTHWVAMYMRPFTDEHDATQKSASPLDAVVKCFIQKKLGSEIDLSLVK
ncbi:phage protein NinX family protein [Acinetobacter puyangensis]|uniref:phage protein NinX family protein n=1 Tax=Acinetobacter puyangensis TaxID=1096779 RepID=UPI003A4D524C